MTLSCCGCITGCCGSSLLDSSDIAAAVVAPVAVVLVMLCACACLWVLCRQGLLSKVLMADDCWGKYDQLLATGNARCICVHDLPPVSPYPAADGLRDNWTCESMRGFLRGGPAAVPG
jgi:hypothetical protein